MILQLSPPLPREVVAASGWTGPTGKGVANFLIDEGRDSDLLWVIDMESTGEVWCVPNFAVRAVKDVTHGVRTGT